MSTPLLTVVIKSMTCKVVDVAKVQIRKRKAATSSPTRLAIAHVNEWAGTSHSNPKRLKLPKPHTQLITLTHNIIILITSTH